MRTISAVTAIYRRSRLLLLLIGIGLAIALVPASIASANVLGVPDSEYNALVAVYDSAGGASWVRSDGWLTNTPGWYGVTISGGHVVQLNLQSNRLSGSIPTELGDLTSLQLLNLRSNRLMGAVPASLMNLSQLQSGVGSISYNGLWTTDSAVAAFLASKFVNWDTTQTIAPTNVSARGTSTVTVSWTPIPYNMDAGYYEVGVSSTADGDYVFDSMRRTATKNPAWLPISGLPADKPQYFVVRAVTLASGNNPVTITSAASAPVLANPLPIPDTEYKALVALYNSTAGQNWTHNDRWMTNLGAWYGVTISGGLVTKLILPGNRLAGSIPSELGALTNLDTLDLRGNQLVGAIPGSLANLTQVQPAVSGISYNGLWNTDSTLATFLASKFPGWDLKQTVAPTNITARGANGAMTVSWTPISYTADAGYYEIGLGSTPGGPYEFDSTRHTTSKSAPSLTFGNVPPDGPAYVVVRAVTTANQYGPTPITSGLSAEVLGNSLGIPDSEFKALVALYNGTGGPNWTHRDKWLTYRTGWYGLGLGSGHVITLNLPANLLTGSIPPELGDLTNLQWLNLGGNRLVGAVPSSVMNMTQLQSVGSNLSYNGLWATDSSLAAFLDSKCGCWSTSQTIAPTNVKAVGTGTVVVSWTPILYTYDIGYYEIGISTTAGGPYTFDAGRRTHSKSSGSLAVSNLAGGTPHFFAVRAVTTNSQCNPSVVTSDPSAEATEWTSVKSSTNNSPTAVVGGIVTAVFPDCFYMEAKNRSYGIRVTTSNPSAAAGSVDISGTLSSDPTTGERCIRADKVFCTGPGEVPPIALSVANMGGGHWNYGGIGGSGQCGVFGGYGLNNIGLLVRLCGHISGRDNAIPPTWFRLEDGSGASVKCVVPAGVAINPGWNYVSVTGISSCEKPQGDLLRLLRVRTAADIVAY